MNLDDRERQKLHGLLINAMMEAVLKLERKHTLGITKLAVFSAVDLILDHFSKTFSGPQLEEKAIDILNRACLFLRDEINSRADEKKIDELEYILSRCMVESTELIRENPTCKLWLPRVNKEYEEANTALDTLLQVWKPMLERSKDITKFLSPPFMELSETRLPALSACISSACLSGNFSDCYDEMKKLDDVALEILIILPAKCFFDQVMTLDQRHIVQVVSRLVGIPAPVLQPNYESAGPSLLAERLHERVVNQDAALDAIVKSIFRTDQAPHPDFKKRPRASLLFLGSSGVGKTEVAKCITEVFFGAEDRLIRVDMSKFREHHTLSMSSTPSLIGSKNKHQESVFQWLAETISKKPYSLILFDKIEKSHLNAMGTLLLDITCGKLSDNDGHSVDLSKAIVILTSHVGAEKLTSLYTGSHAFSRQVASSPGSSDGMHQCSLKTSPTDQALEEARTVFSPDLLSSLDGTVVFDTFGLGVENVTRLIMREKARAISGDKLIVYLSNNVLDVVSNNYSKQPGKAGKAIKSWLEEKVLPLLCGIVEDMADKCYTVYVDTLVGTEELSFRLEDTNFSKETMLSHFKLSFRKFKLLYQTQKEIVDGILQLRNCLSMVLKPMGDSDQSKGDKHFVDTAMLVMGIWCKIIQSGCLLDTDGSKKEVLNSTIVGTHYRERSNDRCQNLKERLLLHGTVENQTVNDHHIEKRPRSFLLMGLTSFGRIELVKRFIDRFKIANEEKSSLIQVDLSEHRNSQSQLFSSSSQSSENCCSSILETVRRCPRSVLLFDRIEKANASAFETLLKILDAGMLNDGRKSMVDFRSTTIIVTTDLGNKDMMAKFFGGCNPYSFKESGFGEGLKHFRSELVYRMDEIVFVDPFSQEQQMINVIKLPIKEGSLLEEDIRRLRKSFYNLFEEDYSTDLHECGKSFRFLSTKYAI